MHFKAHFIFSLIYSLNAPDFEIVKMFSVKYELRFLYILKVNWKGAQQCKELPYETLNSFNLLQLTLKIGLS